MRASPPSRPRRRSPAAAAVAAALAVLLARPSAPAADVPNEKQALIVLRILAYDHALAQRPGSAVRLAVAHSRGGPSSDCGGRMSAAFAKLIGRVVINGKQLAVETMAAGEVSERTLAERQVAVLYVCGGTEPHLADIVRSARAARVLTFTDQRAYLDRGLAIALSEDAAKVGIWVNLVAARAEGARLAGHFLSMSKVVRR
jgi:hypothetical protein